ncbi:ABC transporter permease [candidate division WS5 bacterium]|uniref:ABC transporter permease n=1 Tax=candidate division WS5 bacterium TaxID=2093353 RepID=A0A419DAT2_9BACT|nr:MAG: ABC transporter permease [candidate division WS5 bacterium]
MAINLKSRIKMKLIDILRIASGNLKRNKLRTVLTVSGVVVGVGAIVFLVSLGFGLQKLALEKIVSLEALKVITVTSGGKSEVPLDEKTVEKFKKIAGVKDVSPVTRSIASFKIGDKEAEQVVYGVKPEYMEMENIKISDGKALSGAEKEALVSKEIVANLGLNKEDILDKEIPYSYISLSGGKVEGNLRVVGIFEERGIYVPFGTIKNETNDFAAVKVKAEDKAYVPDVKKAIESMGLNTSVIKDQSKAINQVFYVVNIVLGGFGMIAFFVAAIGIFNTMTISLLERTHEIGVMKAIGGNSKDIAMIFITESALIGFLGGIFGLTTGWLFGFLLNLLVNFIATESGGEAITLFSIPAYFAVLTVFFSFFISTVAGIWPAKRAAKLNPLEALRYE